jgi:hypothetical protein
MFRERITLFRFGQKTLWPQILKRTQEHANTSPAVTPAMLPRQIYLV